MSKELKELEVCIGSLDNQKLYLKWSDVKDICTYAVSAAYEQTKRENDELKNKLEIAVDCLKDIIEQEKMLPLPLPSYAMTVCVRTLNHIKELDK